MGHHYNPRQHLRRFAIDSKEKCVWMYDKSTSSFCEAGIASVAQEPGYYEPDIEKALASEVESPSKAAIDKILTREKLSNEERSVVSLFLMLMLTRGPRQRRKSIESIPGALAETLLRIEAEIRQWIEDEPDNPNAHERLRELDEVRKKYSTDIPQQILDQIRRPFWSPKTVECIHNMHWHILPAPPGTYFVTSDTPAHFFECYGLGTIDSEYTVSLSKNYALVGEHRRNWGVSYHEKTDRQIAKEINRRIISHAERFVFSTEKAAWIETVAKNDAPYLSRILW